MKIEKKESVSSFYTFSVFIIIIITISLVSLKVSSGYGVISEIEVLKVIDRPDDKIDLFSVLRGLNIKMGSERLKRLSRLIVREAGRYNFDPVFICSLISVESSFRIYAKSQAGAMGLMQIMPQTAWMIAEKTGIRLKKISDLYIPEINIRMGVWYLNKLMRQFKDPLLALTAYNYGPGNVRIMQRKFEVFPELPYVWKVADIYITYLNELILGVSPIYGENYLSESAGNFFSP